MKIRNDYSYRGDDRWDWELYLDSDNAGELDDIKQVRYVLHPTFPSPVRTISDPKNGFRLKSNGWGSFQVKAVVEKKDGRKISLKHQLELEYPTEE